MVSVDRFEVAALLVGFLQFQQAVGLRLVSDHQRLVLLVLLAYPNGVWWFRLVDWNAAPMWSAFAVLVAVAGPALWVGRLLMEVEG